MVGFHGDDDHEHDDDELCPRCQFIERLAEYLNAAAEDDTQAWHDATGQIIEHMHTALWALHRLRAESTTDYIDEIDSAGEAARSLTALGDIVVRLDEGLKN
jgi:hypothetical protein